MGEAGAGEQDGRVRPGTLMNRCGDRAASLRAEIAERKGMSGVWSSDGGDPRVGKEARDAFFDDARERYRGFDLELEGHRLWSGGHRCSTECLTIIDTRFCGGPLRKRISRRRRPL